MKLIVIEMKLIAFSNNFFYRLFSRQLTMTIMKVPYFFRQQLLSPSPSVTGDQQTPANL